MRFYKSFKKRITLKVLSEHCGTTGLAANHLKHPHPTACCLVGVLVLRFQPSFQLIRIKRRQVMVQMLGALLHTWEMWMDFWALA